MAGDVEDKITVTRLGEDRILIDGEELYLAKRREDTDVPSYMISGSRYIRLPEFLNFRFISGGRRLQISCKEFRGVGNLLVYVDQLVSFLKHEPIEGRVEVEWKAYFRLDDPEWTKKRGNR